MLHAETVILKELQDARNQPEWEQQLSDVWNWNKGAGKKNAVVHCQKELSNPGHEKRLMPESKERIRV